VAVVHRAAPADLEQAIQAAVEAFRTTRRLPLHRRAAALRAIAAGIEARAEELARTIALEAGKPIKQARIEVARSIDDVLGSRR
jgi:acyl-CoA reductase-like NAD-dependent aldehyde dehydrogenase